MNGQLGVVSMSCRGYAFPSLGWSQWSCPRNVVSIVRSFAGRGPSSSAAAWAAWPVLVPAAANGDLWVIFEWINKYQKSFKYHLPIIVDPFKLLVILENRCRWIKNWRHTTKYTEIYGRYCPLPCFDTRGCVWQIGYVWKLCSTPNCKAIYWIMCAAIFSTSNHWSCCKVSIKYGVSRTYTAIFVLARIPVKSVEKMFTPLRITQSQDSEAVKIWLFYCKSIQ